MLGGYIGRVGIAEQYQVAPVRHDEALRKRTARASWTAVDEAYLVGPSAVGIDRIRPADLIVAGIAAEVYSLMPAQIATAIGDKESGSGKGLHRTANDVS